MLNPLLINAHNSISWDLFTHFTCNVFSSLSSALWFESILVPVQLYLWAASSPRRAGQQWRVSLDHNPHKVWAVPLIEIINAAMMLMKRESTRKTLGFLGWNSALCGSSPDFIWRNHISLEACNSQWNKALGKVLLSYHMPYVLYH